MSDKTNYELAAARANEIDARIIATLQSGKSFRVEAGAGSGKTYSLHRVIQWIDKNKAKDFAKKNRQVGQDNKRQLHYSINYSQFCMG